MQHITDNTHNVSARKNRKKKERWIVVSVQCTSPVRQRELVISQVGTVPKHKLIFTNPFILPRSNTDAAVLDK